MARADEKFSRFIKVRSKVESIEVVVQEVRRVVGTASNTKGVNRRVFPTSTYAWGGTGDVGTQAEVEIRLRINNPAQEGQPEEAGNDLKMSNMQCIKSGRGRGEEPGNLRKAAP